MRNPLASLGSALNNFFCLLFFYSLFFSSISILFFSSRLSFLFYPSEHEYLFPSLVRLNVAVSTMPKLLDLPNELLILIVSNFDHWQWKSELQALCLTSKLLREIAQSLLYCRYVREVKCKCCHKNASPPGRIVPMILFTRTLITRPDLAARVRRATFDASEDEFDEDDVRKAQFDAYTIKVLAEGFQRLPEDDRARWFMEAVAMMSNPYLILLSTLMPNLEQLNLTIDEEGLADFEPLFTDWSPSSIKQPFLMNLKSLNIRDLTRTESDALEGLVDAMALPQLEEFTLVYLNGDAEGCPCFTFAPGSLNISKLCLLDACLDAESLESIVAGCKRLEYFTYYGANFDGSNIEDSGQFDPSELICILDCQKKSLRSIRCNLDWEDVHPPDWKQCSKYGSFEEFDKICHLDLDQYPWAENQGLPASLHCLAIGNISFPIVDTIISLNQRTCTGYSPLLGNPGDLPTLHQLTICPRDNSPNGMLNVPSRYSYPDVHTSQRVENRFLSACNALYHKIVTCSFFVAVDHDVFHYYMETVQGC